MTDGVEHRVNEAEEIIREDPGASRLPQKEMPSKAARG